MTTKRTDAMTATVMSLIGMSWVLPGCVTLAPPAVDPLVERSRERQQTAESKPAETDASATLAAVEAFLEETKEYQLASASSAPASPSADVIRVSQDWGAAGGTMAPAPGRMDPTQAPSETFANTQVLLSEAAPIGSVPALPVLRSVSIRPVTTAEAGPIESAPTNLTNQPLDTHAANRSSLLDRFLSHLKEQALESSDFDSEWSLRMTQLALHRDAEAVAVAAHLPGTARDMMVTLIRAAQAVRRVAREPAPPDEEVLERIDELHRIVADRADPSVTTVALCRKVTTYGVYEEMAAHDFVAGRTTQTIVYSEIRNLRSEPTDEGRFRTRLATRVEVLTADGRSVWEHEEPQIVDLCRRPRTDFFIAQSITLPPTLPAGAYVLKMMVEDKLSGRADEAVHGFSINSALSVAQPR